MRNWTGLSSTFFFGLIFGRLYRPNAIRGDTSSGRRSTAQISFRLCGRSRWTSGTPNAIRITINMLLCYTIPCRQRTHSVGSVCAKSRISISTPTELQRVDIWRGRFSRLVYLIHDGNWETMRLLVLAEFARQDEFPVNAFLSTTSIGLWTVRAFVALAFVHFHWCRCRLRTAVSRRRNMEFRCCRI